MPRCDLRGELFKPSSTSPTRNHSWRNAPDAEDGAFYTRRYSGETLCASCFRASIVEKTRRTISKYDMLSHGQRVGIAVSGGKDSLSLLQVLHELNEKKGCELVALTVDEGVEGYRDESIDHASSLARKLGVEHVVVSYKELYGFSLDQALDWKDETRRTRPAASAESSGGGQSTRLRPGPGSRSWRPPTIWTTMCRPS